MDFSRTRSGSARQGRFGLCREKIERFRDHLVADGKKILAEAPHTKVFLHRALGIPKSYTLVPSTLETIQNWLLYSVLSARKNGDKIRSLLVRIRTQQGRSFIFKHHIEGVLLPRCYFGDDLDFVLRHFNFTSADELRQCDRIDLEWGKLCYQLGITSPSDALGVINTYRYQIDITIALILAELNVIRSADMLNQFALPEENYGYSPRWTHTDLLPFRESIQILINAGVAPKSIIGLAKHSAYRFDPTALRKTLAALNVSGDHLSKLIELLGDAFLTVPPENWAFVRDILCAQTPEEFAQFDKLLKVREPHQDFVIALKGLVSGPNELSNYQDLISSISHKQPPNLLLELKLLTSDPYNFGIKEVKKAEGFFLAKRNLSPYLEVLVAHGYDTPSSILEFQSCYSRLEAKNLSDWLDIAKPFSGNQKVSDVAAWTYEAARVGSISSFRYLKENHYIKSFKELGQALKITSIGPAFLRFLLEERKLSTLKALTKWYFDGSAYGIKQFVNGHSFDASERALANDAFERKNFALMAGNLTVVWSHIEQMITTQLGRHPSDPSEIDQYREAHSALYQKTSAELAPKLKKILDSTGGIIFPSLLKYIDDNEGLSEKLAALNPLVEELLQGMGPTAHQLSDIEMEAIGLVYQVTPDAVSKHWATVLGHETDLSHLKQPNSYPMVWHRAHLKSNGQIDERGLAALHTAAEFAKNFIAHYQENMHLACEALHAKHLDDAAADEHSLRQHLGMLLAIVAGDSEIQKWIENGFYVENIDGELQLRIDEHDHGYLESLLDLFSVQLDDALREQGTSFVDGLSDDGYTVLATRLQTSSGPVASKESLRLAIVKSKDTVTKAYTSWVAKQKRAFTKTKSEAGSALTAVISKSPVAFFAKSTVRLCTANNTGMWHESRHAHLLVFSEIEKRLLGMALLYFQTIPEIDRHRNTLIIRALNPTHDALTSHDERSIIESFFDVAQQIASRNDCVAVAFPYPHGMHLMSNHAAIESVIEEHFMPEAEEVLANFHAYTSDSTHEMVDRLFVTWRAGGSH